MALDKPCPEAAVFFAKNGIKVPVYMEIADFNEECEEKNFKEGPFRERDDYGEPYQAVRRRVKPVYHPNRQVFGVLKSGRGVFAWIRITKHVEAFCLMQYQDRITGEIEIIWNSRDGVTPFIVTSRRGNEAVHAAWSEDKSVPDHRPKPGDRIFVDLTLVRAKERASDFVEKWWDVGASGLTSRFKTKEQAVKELAKSEKLDGRPDLIEFTGGEHVGT